MRKNDQNGPEAPDGDSMNDALKMQISAFVDGELPADEAELLTRRLSKDADLRRQAGQYLAIGRAVRKEQDFAGASALRSRISAAVAAEEWHAAEPVADKQRYLRPVAGVAIAASVAMLALFGLQRGELADTGIDATTAEMVAIDDATYTEPGAATAERDRPGDVLTQYYLSHGATSGELGANGVLSRLVTLELREGEIVEVASPQAGDEDIVEPVNGTGQPPAQDE